MGGGTSRSEGIGMFCPFQWKYESAPVTSPQVHAVLWMRQPVSRGMAWT